MYGLELRELRLSEVFPQTAPNDEVRFWVLELGVLRAKGKEHLFGSLQKRNVRLAGFAPA